MGKLTYEQMRQLAELGDDGGRVVIKNREGKVLRPALKQWKGSHPAGHSSFFGVGATGLPAPTLKCASVLSNGSHDQGVRRGLGKGRMRVR